MEFCPLAEPGGERIGRSFPHVRSEPRCGDVWRWVTTSEMADGLIVLTWLLDCLIVKLRHVEVGVKNRDEACSFGCHSAIFAVAQRYWIAMRLMASSPFEFITEADTVSPVKLCRTVSVFGISTIAVNWHDIPVTRVGSPPSR